MQLPKMFFAPNVEVYSYFSSSYIIHPSSQMLFWGRECGSRLQVKIVLQVTAHTTLSTSGTLSTFLWLFSTYCKNPLASLRGVRVVESTYRTFNMHVNLVHISFLTKRRIFDTLIPFSKDMFKDYYRHNTVLRLYSCFFFSKSQNSTKSVKKYIV